MGKQHGYRGSGSAMSRTYRTWDGMWTRCSNVKDPNYRWYGGKGISVCERWEDFRNFLADMGERPEGQTLDRIDRSGNYELSNCRWATPKEQTINREITEAGREAMRAANRRRNQKRVAGRFA
jgi:hypothetical protein